jgi:large subunit ribosomal protein L21
VGYAIIRAGGSQLRVSRGEVVRIPSVAQEIGSSIEFEVLARGGGDGVEIGTPLVDGARVSGTVLAHGRTRKIIVFKTKRRKQYKKTHGHRQNFTSVRIDSLGLGVDDDKIENAEAQSAADNSAAAEADQQDKTEVEAAGSEGRKGAAVTKARKKRKAAKSDETESEEA